MPREFDPNRLKQLVVAGYTPNEHERGAAATALYRYWLDTGVHPTEVEISHGVDLIDRNQKMLKKQQEQLRRFAQERAVYRAHASPAVVRLATQAAGSDEDRQQYCELVELAFQLWPNGVGLARTWKRSLIEITGCSPADIVRWEDGVLPVPQKVLDQLRARIKPKKGQGQGLPKLSLVHMSILHAVAKHDSASHDQIAQMMEQVLNIDPRAENAKRTTWRHPIAARLPELHTTTKYGKSMLKASRGRHKGKKLEGYSFTEFGRAAYDENLPRFTGKLP